MDGRRGGWEGGWKEGRGYRWVSGRREQREIGKQSELDNLQSKPFLELWSMAFLFFEVLFASKMQLKFTIDAPYLVPNLLPQRAAELSGCHTPPP